MSCRRVGPSVAEFLTSAEGHYKSSGRRAIRTALEKARTSSPRWLIPRNVLVTRPIRLGGLAFRHRLHRIRNDIALMDWARPAHVFEAWRDAELRKRLAALGEGGAQGATGVHQSAHAAAATCIPEAASRALPAAA